MPSAIVMDPDAVLDIAFDFSSWLADTETISNHALSRITATNITADSTSESGGVVTVWVSSIAEGKTATVTCHVVTDQGREDDRAITIVGKQR